MNRLLFPTFRNDHLVTMSEPNLVVGAGQSASVQYRSHFHPSPRIAGKSWVPFRNFRAEIEAGNHPRSPFPLGRPQTDPTRVDPHGRVSTSILIRVVRSVCSIADRRKRDDAHAIESNSNLRIGPNPSGHRRILETTIRILGRRFAESLWPSVTNDFFVR